jgi:hypothetical protein
MEFLIIGVVTAINIIFIKFKVDKKRYQDALFDAALLILVTLVFSGSYGGMVVAMIASMIISIYLYANPPNFLPRTASIPKVNLSNVDLSDTKDIAEKLEKFRTSIPLSPQDVKQRR